jgi:hypothetical protein
MQPWTMWKKCRVGVVVASRRRVDVGLKPLRLSPAVRIAGCDCAPASFLYRTQEVRPVVEELT